jgi:hypothetical protein
MRRTAQCICSNTLGPRREDQRCAACPFRETPFDVQPPAVPDPVAHGVRPEPSGRAIAVVALGICHAETVLCGVEMIKHPCPGCPRAAQRTREQDEADRWYAAELERLRERAPA